MLHIYLDFALTVFTRFTLFPKNIDIAIGHFDFDRNIQMQMSTSYTSDV